MKTFWYTTIIFIFFSCKKNSDVLNTSTSNNANNNTGVINDTIGRHIQLWGMTAMGGMNDSGVIYKIRGDGSDYTEVFSFSAITGGRPFGTLCKSPNGKLYGMTTTGGSIGGGTLFSFDTALHQFTKLAELETPEMGGHNFSGMILGNDNNLYGTTASKLFKINPYTDSISILADFISSNYASGPWGGTLFQGTDGKLYGASKSGGPNPVDQGMIFSFDIPNNELEVLYSFNSLTEIGYAPWGSIYQASDSSLYGFCSLGTNLLFKLDNDGNYSILKKFDVEEEGKAPWWNCGVVQANGNKLYGLTMNGGGGVIGNNTFRAGVLFSYDIITHDYSVEHSFGGMLPGNVIDGSSPMGTVLKASNQYLYGTTSMGSFGFYPGTIPTFGSIFRYLPQNQEYRFIHSFKISGGNNPIGNLIEF